MRFYVISELKALKCFECLMSVLCTLVFVIQVYSIVDEMFLAGELRETSQTKEHTIEFTIKNVIVSSFFLS